MAKSHKSRNWDKKRNRRSRNMRGGALSEEQVKAIEDLLAKKELTGNYVGKTTVVSVASDPIVTTELVVSDDDYSKVLSELTELNGLDVPSAPPGLETSRSNNSEMGSDQVAPLERSASEGSEMGSDPVAPLERSASEGSEMGSDPVVPESGGKKNKKNKNKKGGKSKKRNKNKKGKQNNSKKRR
jgi:hypothetical protein